MKTEDVQDLEITAGRICVQVAAALGQEMPACVQGGPKALAVAAELALPAEGPGCTVRLIGPEESRELNRHHRGRDKPTNVLSFPIEMPPELAALLPDELKSPSLGDIALCLDVAKREAVEQEKPLANHLVHLIVHGVLHLRGFDHITESEADAMEQLERELLASQGIADPYDDKRGQIPDSHG